MILAPRLLFIALLVASTACASSNRAGTGTVDRNRILASELTSATETNLYDYIAKYRPRWLTPRGSGSIPGAGRGTSVGSTGSLIVYLDEQRQGGTDILRSLSRNGVKQIRFYDITEAQQRFPDVRASAVIQVITR
jgi:hypothetical protein